MSYTKGRWISGFVESGWGLVSQADGKCIVFAEKQDGGIVPTEADARLMESAPDLLNACKKAEAELSAINKILGGVPGMPGCIESEKELRELRAAIAKAEGVLK